ncbi:MAG: Gpi16 subunit GPI transamidase component [Piptocephalis tieghemiana]|nr:MAG: Gpi16 subunit GPI transamidase component [Piptocephalis tieghemiana]
MISSGRQGCLLLSFLLVAAPLTLKAELSRANRHGEERFSEHLRLSPLPHQHLLAHFNFTTRVPLAQEDTPYGHHYHIFPRAIGDIVQEYQAEELHFTLGRGNWDHQRWGYPPVESVGSGADLWAYLTPQASSPPEMQTRWGRLTGAMAGLFCASLNFMDSTATASPALSFPPLGRVSSRAHLMRSSLAHESLCTENLTPFIKQLPCRDQAGISLLLSPHTILSSTFHVISIHNKRERPCLSPYLEVTQLVTTVLKSSGKNGDQGPLDLASSFGEALPQGSCPIAFDSMVQVVDSQGAQRDMSLITPEISEVQKGWDEVTSILSTDPIFSSPSSPFSSPVSIRVSRRLAGTGQEGGKFIITIVNTHLSESVSATYLDVIPWYLRPYLSTLTATMNGHPSPGIIQAQRYQTARDRERPSIIELILQLPPNSILTLSLDVDRAMLKYSEHPPDANRGFDLPPAILTLHHRPDQGSSEEGHGPWRLYTSPLLVSLPTPDFSMPYNVITLTCTTVALFFGSMFNLLTRQLVPVPGTKG